MNALDAMPSGGTLTIETADAELRTLERGFLKACGYTVLAAGHGEEAMRICLEYSGPIHLLVTDLIMPHMNGRELARQVVMSWPSIKVLYVSGYPDDILIPRSKEPVFPKPFASDALLRTVRNVFDVTIDSPA